MSALPGGEPSPTFVICGDNPLVHQLARQLTDRFADATVTVVLPNRRGSYVPQLERMDRVRIMYAERLDLAALRAADVENARALALVDQADVENFHAALRAHELNPDIRLVLRMFNTRLGFRIRRLFSDCVVLSISQLAAPSFIAEALGEDAQNYLRLGARSLYVAPAKDTPAQQVVSGLVDGPDGVELRSSKAPVNQVLALGVREPYSPGARDRWRMLVRFMFGHNLIRLLVGLLTLIAVGCLLMVLIGNSWGGAVYETLLDSAGAAQSEPDKSAWFKVLQLSVVFVGLAMTPVVTALVVGGVVRGQLSDHAVDPARMEGHVVVAGLGNVGMRVVEQLSDLGVPVVALDNDENARGMALARSLGVPVVIGQATWEDTLRAVGVPKARALVLLTSNDAVNLEAAMLGQSYRDDLRVVLRLSDDDLAERVQLSLGTAIVRSVFQLAAAGFAAAVVERGVIATLPINQDTLLVAELPVEEGSALAGLRIADAGLSHHSRVVALQRAGDDEPQWKPSANEVLEVGHQLVVVATRTGLDELLEPNPARIEPVAVQRAPEKTGAGPEQSDTAAGTESAEGRADAPAPPSNTARRDPSSAAPGIDDAGAESTAQRGDSATVRREPGNAVRRRLSRDLPGHTKAEENANPEDSTETDAIGS